MGPSVHSLIPRYRRLKDKELDENAWSKIESKSSHNYMLLHCSRNFGKSEAFVYDNDSKKDERGESEDEQESIDESEPSKNERLPVLDCIEVRKRNP
jgi:hypothetical protein